MPAVKATFAEVMKEHRARFERLSERRGVERLRRIYDQAQGEVAARIARLQRAGRGQTFTAFQQRQILAQLLEGQRMVMERMGEALGAAARDTQTDMLHGLIRAVDRLESKFSGSTPILPVEDAARFAGVIDSRATSLLRRHRSSFGNYGALVVQKSEEQLAISLLQNESTASAIDRIRETADVQWWKGEQIVRTELAWAANATHADGIKEIAEVLPDMMQQWREYVGDDGTPLDDRVGVDSLALHGQVCEPGGVFTTPARAPDGEDVGDSLSGEQIAFPPNRPNDRAVLTPWRSGWGIPAWRWAGGRRVAMR